MFHKFIKALKCDFNTFPELPGMRVSDIATVTTNKMLLSEDINGLTTVIG